MPRPMATVYEVEPGREASPGWYFLLWGHGGPEGPHANRSKANEALRLRAAELGYEVKAYGTGWAPPVPAQKKENAFHACRLLIAAYDRGEQRGGSVAWEDVDAAHVAAKAALGLPPDESD